jgi:HPt (histidine-containing phosphotransfer) domain-containing protein
MLDYARLKQLYGDDKEYAADMIQTFLEEVLPDFVVMDELVIQKDLDALAQHAHKLKPTLGMVGLSEMEILMNEIDKKAKEETDIAVLTQLWHNFQQHLEQSIPILKTELLKLTQ